MGEAQSKEQDLCEQANQLWDKKSKYSVQELKAWHEEFKIKYPSGHLSKEEFKELYNRNYPKSTSTDLYVNQVFATFDLNDDGHIEFNEFMTALGVQFRGTTEEKLSWMFSLFDMNNDGSVTKQEMLCIMRAIYKIHGKRASCRTQHVKRDNPNSHVNRLFENLDTGRDGKLSREEFLMLKDKDPTLMHLFFGIGMNLE